MVIPGNHDFYPIAHILFKNAGIDWGYGFSPNVHFLGDRGKEIGGVEFESSRIYNVSRLDEDYEIAYEPTWVEV